MIIAILSTIAQFELGSGVNFLQTPLLPQAAVSVAAAPGEGLPHPDAPLSRPTVRFIPLSLGSSEAQTGPGAEAGTWHVEVCAGPADALIPRARIMETAPILRYLPDEFMVALLSQRTTKSKAAKAKDILRYLGLAGGLAAVLLGSQGGAVAGISVVSLLDYGPRLSEQISPPIYSLPRPLPIEVFVRSGSCAEYNILAARIRGAAVLGPFPVKLQ